MKNQLATCPIVEDSSEPVDRLTGIIKIKQSEADKLIESEEWY